MGYIVKTKSGVIMTINILYRVIKGRNGKDGVSVRCRNLRTTFLMKIIRQEANRDEEVYFILIMNGKSAGGFKKVAPLASLSDGLLDVYILNNALA